MTTVRKNLLLRKQQLFERLRRNPAPNEREQIEGHLAQIDTALDLLKEPGKSSDEQ